jgi:hypothetical protein
MHIVIPISDCFFYYDEQTKTAPQLENIISGIMTSTVSSKDQLLVAQVFMVP